MYSSEGGQEVMGFGGYFRQNLMIMGYTDRLKICMLSDKFLIAAIIEQGD